MLLNCYSFEMYYFKSLYYNKVNSVMIVVANVLQGER